MLYENPVPLRYALTNAAYRSVTVDKIAGIFEKRIWQSYLPPSYATGIGAKSESSIPWLSNVKALGRSRKSNHMTFHNDYVKFRRQFGAPTMLRPEADVPISPRVAPLECERGRKVRNPGYLSESTAT